LIIAIASGKGGTGKTTIAVNFALSIKNVQILDVDVEEPNANVFFNMDLTEKKEVDMVVPTIDETTCTFCGACSRFCAYHALAVVPNKVLVFPELCHSCKGCALVCPVDAVKWEKRSIGVVSKGTTEDILFSQGELYVGEAMATPVIRAVKRGIDQTKTVIIDAPPGTSCPMIEAIKGVDYVILVTEPTPFGLHDLTLAVDVVRKQHIPFGVIINQEDIGDKKVDLYCQKEHIPILLRIPHDKRIASYYSNGEAFVKHMPEFKKEFEQLFARIKKEYVQ
jgi:MinD superfamily P-loop ATPase